MAQVLTQEGALLKQRTIIGLAPVMGQPFLHLFSSAHNAAHTDTEATFAAIEAAVSGYSPKLMSTGQWVLAPIADGAQMTYPLLTWNFLAAVTIYGYWLSDNSNTYSWLAETFANPFVFGPGGGTFSLQFVTYDVSQPFTLGPCY